MPFLGKYIADAMCESIVAQELLTPSEFGCEFDSGCEHFICLFYFLYNVLETIHPTAVGTPLSRLFTSASFPRITKIPLI